MKSVVEIDAARPTAIAPRPSAATPSLPAADSLPSVVLAPTQDAESTLLRRSGWTLVGRLSMAASRGLGLVLVSRALGAAAFGEYSLVVTSYAIASGLGTLGLDQAHVHASGARRQSTISMLRNAFWTTSVLGTAAGMLLLAIVQLLRVRIFDGTPPGAMTLTAIVLPAILQHNALSGMVIGRGWFRYHGISESVKWFCHLGIVGLLARSGQLTIETAVAALYFPIVIGGVVHGAAILYADRIPPVKVLLGRPDWRGLREVASFGTKACAINVSHILHLRLDVYLIKYFSSSAVVGRYALAVSITDVLLYLGRSVGLVLFAQRAAIPAVSPVRVPGVARIVVGLVAVLSVLLFSFGESIVTRLFGPQFSGCTMALLCRLPGLLAESASFVLVGDLLGLARMRPILLANLAAVGLGGLLNVCFMPIGGIVVAAGAFTVASWLRLSLLARAHARSTGSQRRAYLVPVLSDLAMFRRRRAQNEDRK